MILKQVYYKINLRISLKPDGQLEKRHQIIGNTFIDFRTSITSFAIFPKQLLFCRKCHFVWVRRFDKLIKTIFGSYDFYLKW